MLQTSLFVLAFVLFITLNDIPFISLSFTLSSGAELSETHTV